MNKKLTKLLSVFIIAGAIGTGAAFAAVGCNNKKPEDQQQTQTPTVTSVTVSAAGGATTVEAGKTLQFSAEVVGENSPATTVTWSIKEGATATGATIDENTGLLTAGSVTGTVTVVATSTADTSKSDELTVEVKAATPAAKTYTVTWKNGDTVLETDTEVAENATPSYDGTTPTQPETAQYTYTFKGWTDGKKSYGKDEALPAVTGDVTYTATYDEAARKYTVTWKNADGTVLETDENVEYGTTPTYDGAKPEMPDTDAKTFTFKDWGTIVAVTGDVTYTATYDEAARKYTITYKRDDGSTIKTEQVAYGTTPSFGETLPTKDATVDKTYTFKEWDKAFSAVNGEATYVASFTEAAREYTIKWLNKDGTQLKTEQVAYGETPNFGTENPTYTEEGKSFAFKGWTPEIVAVAGDATYTAEYEELAAGQFAIKYDLDGKGTLPDGITTDGKLTNAPTPDIPGYEFGGWYEEDTHTTLIDFATKEFEGETTIYAKLTPIEYTITFKANEQDEGTPVKFTVESTEIQVPAVPEETGYTYTWGEYDLTKLENQTVLAQRKATKYTIKYDLKGGENATTNPTEYTIETESFEFADPKKDGFRFNGWTVDVDGTSAEISGVEKGSTGDLVLTADWVEVVTLRVNDVNGTELVSGEYDVGSVPKIEELVAALTAVNKLPTGHEVYGVYTAFNKETGDKTWYQNEELKVDTTFIVTFKLTAEGYEAAYNSTVALKNIAIDYYMIGEDGAPEAVKEGQIFAADGLNVNNSGMGTEYRTYSKTGDAYNDGYIEYVRREVADPDKYDNAWYKKVVATTAEGQDYDSYVAAMLPNFVFGGPTYVSYDDVKDVYTIKAKEGEAAPGGPDTAEVTVVDGLITKINIPGLQEIRYVVNGAVDMPDANDVIDYDSKFVELMNGDDNIIAEHFTGKGGKLPEFRNAYGIKGIYTRATSVDTSENHYTEAKDGWAVQTDGGAGETGTVIDVGLVTGTVKGTFKFKYSEAATGWTPIRFVGTNADKTQSEIFGLRNDGKDNKVIKYRLNGGSTFTSGETPVAVDTAEHELYFEIDLTAHTITVTIDGKAFVTGLDIGITELVSIEAVSSNSNARTVAIDNVAINATELTLDEAKTKLLANLASELTAMTKEPTDTTAAGTHYINKDSVKQAYDNGVDQINQAAEVSALLDIYSWTISDMYSYESDEVIKAARTAALKEIEAIDANQYTIEGLTDGDEIYNNKDDFDNAVAWAIEQINASTYAQENEEIVANLKRQLEGDATVDPPEEPQIKNNAAMLELKKTAAKTALEEYTNPDYDTLTSEQQAEVDATITAEKTSGAEAITNAASIEEVNAKLNTAISNIDNAIGKYTEFPADVFAKAETELDNHIAAEYLRLGVDDADTVTRDFVGTTKTSQLGKIKEESEKEGATAESVYAAITKAEEAITAVIEVRVTTKYQVTFVYNGAPIEGATLTDIAYGGTVDVTKLPDPVAGDNAHIVKSWKKGSDVFDFTSKIFDNVELTADVVEAVHYDPVEHTFVFADLIKTNSSLADKDILTQNDFNSESNSFITIGSHVAYRPTQKNCIQAAKNSVAFSVKFGGAGTLEVTVRGTGEKADTEFYLEDADGVKVKATYTCTCTATDNVYKMASSNFEKFTFTVAKAGTYSFVVSAAAANECRIQTIVQKVNAYKEVKVPVDRVEAAEDCPTEVTAGQSIVLKANALATEEGKTPTNSAIEWSITAGSDYATIDSKTGVLTVKAGVAHGSTITVKVTSVDNSEKYATKDIVVTNVLTEAVTITRQDGEAIVEGTIEITNSVTLVATIDEAATIQTITWSSDNEDVATVENGVVTFVSVGTAVITATADGNKTAQVTIECTEIKVDKVEFTDEYSTVDAGASIQLTAKASSNSGETPNNTNLTWSIDDASKAYATIDQTGLLTVDATASTGTITVTVTSQADTSKTVSKDITINKIEVASVTYAADCPTAVHTGSEAQLTADVKSATEGTAPTVTALKWEIVGAVGADNVAVDDPATIATIDEATGKLTGVADGKVTVKATSTDGTNISTADKVIEVITITMTNAKKITVGEGNNVTLAATVTPEKEGRTVTWALTAGDTIATLADGVVTLNASAAGGDKITVTATTEGVTKAFDIEVANAVKVWHFTNGESTTQNNQAITGCDGSITIASSSKFNNKSVTATTVNGSSVTHALVTSGSNKTVTITALKDVTVTIYVSITNSGADTVTPGNITVADAATGNGDYAVTTDAPIVEITFTLAKNGAAKITQNVGKYIAFYEIDVS